MWLIQSFYRSLFDIAWIREQRDGLGRAFVYGIIFLIAVFAVRLIPLSFFILPKAIESVETDFAQSVPDFTASWEGGQLAVSNLPQPYTAIKTFDDDTLRIVIDTVSTTTPAIESFVKESNDSENTAVLLVTRDDFSFYDPDDKSIQKEKFAGLNDLTVTKSDVQGFIAKVKSYGSWIGAGLVVLGVFLLLIGKFIGLLILSLFVYILARLRKFEWTYRQIFIVALYALTLPTLIATTAVWLGMPFGSLSTLVFLFLMYLTVTGFDSQEKKPA